MYLYKAVNLHNSLYTGTCTLLLGNQSLYRQITSHEKGGAVSGEDGNRVHVQDRFKEFQLWHMCIYYIYAQFL